MLLDLYKLNNSVNLIWVDLALNEQVNLSLDIEFKLVDAKLKLLHLYENRIKEEPL